VPITAWHVSYDPPRMICDYEGSDYETRFWKNANRGYEDTVERVAIKRMLPGRGRRVIEFGAAFGRLADLYTGYDSIVLLDYSRSMLENARKTWGHDPRFIFVAADLYQLPLISGVLSAATMIRVIHHIADVPAALAGIRRALAPGATFVLEFANKRNLKALARHALGKQSWNPNDEAPVEFVKLNFDFHPTWMMREVQQAGFGIEHKLTASYLRLGVLKRTLPLKLMVGIDSALQRTARLGLYSPSVFLQLRAARNGPDNTGLTGDALFCSPKSGGALRRDGNSLVCDTDGTRWEVDGNLYDFKTPLR
jgi:ubiquinone/menaquinone biosynthesis C-methylase UbiE